MFSPFSKVMEPPWVPLIRCRNVLTSISMPTLPPYWYYTNTVWCYPSPSVPTFLLLLSHCSLPGFISFARSCVVYTKANLPHTYIIHSYHTHCNSGMVPLDGWPLSISLPSGALAPLPWSYYARVVLAIVIWTKLDFHVQRILVSL